MDKSQQPDDDTPEQDGTLHDAARVMDDLDQEEGQQPDAKPGRAPDGKFKAKEIEGKDESEDEDGDWFEIPGEDGKAERYKVDDVWKGYQRASELEAEVETLRRAQPMPAEFEQALRSTIQERSNYAQALQQWAAYNEPRQPDPNLVDPASANYDPEAYHRQLTEFAHAQENQRRVTSELERLQSEDGEQREALFRAAHAREKTKLLEAWPEITTKGTVEQVRGDLERFYGIDAQTLATVQDHRFYKVAKDALAYRAQAAKAKEAVKVVKGKPKLFPGGARQSGAKAGKFNDALGRLSKSGSLDDAADALEGLI